MALVVIPLAGSGDAPPSYLWKLREYCSDRGILLIDTGPAIRQAAGEAPTHWPMDGHCTPHGYKAVAGAVYEALVQAHMVP